MRVFHNRASISSQFHIIYVVYEFDDDELQKLEVNRSKINMIIIIKLIYFSIPEPNNHKIFFKKITK